MRRSAAFAVIGAGCLLFAAAPSPAGGRWTPTDSAFQIVVIGMQVTDWGQTRAIANGYRSESVAADGTPMTTTYHETNPLLGEKPSTGRVDAYFLGAVVAHAVVSYLLPQPYRRVWQTMTIAVEGHFIIRNDQIGLKIDF